MAPPTKTTAGLPESSLLIAPNKNKAAASKKRRRPAFRPGQRAASKTTSSNKHQNTAPATKKKKPSGAAPVEEEKSTTATQPANESMENVPPEVAEKVTPEQQEKTAPTKDRVAEATKTAASTSATTPENPKASTSKSDAPADSSNAERKEKPTKTAPKSRSASARQLKAKLPPKALKKMAPVSILHGKKKSTTTTRNTTAAPTNKSAATKKKSGTSKVKAKAIAPLKPGRIRKSTGLVLAGASRIEANKKDPPAQPQQFLDASKNKNMEGKDNDGMPSLQNARAVSATAITAAAAEVQTGEGQVVPPPKEGEALLGHFCSKFRVKSTGNKIQAKKKKDQEAKTSKLSNQRASEDDKEEEEPTAGPVVQIIDGEIVLQESSMVVERGGAAGLISSNRSNRNEEDEYAVVEEDNEMAVVGASYNSFVSRKSKPQHWTLEETKLFYEALRQVGTDFMLMSEFYPSRNRKQLKKKYQREYTKNAKLVELALHPSQQKPLDLTIFQVNQTEVQQQVKVIKLKEKEDAAKAKEDAAKAIEDAVKAKEAEEKRIQDEIDNPPVVEKKTAGSESDDAADKENGMEVVLEDEGEMPHPTSEGGKASSMISKNNQQKSNDEGAAVEEPEAEEERPAQGESLWPDARNMDNVFGEGEEFDENIVVEEDPMILEEYQYGDEFDEIATHNAGGDTTGDKEGDDGQDEKNANEDEAEKGAEDVNAGTDTAAAESTPAEDPEVPVIPSPAAAPRNPKPLEPALSLLLTAKKKKTSTKKPKFRSARPAKKKK